MLQFLCKSSPTGDSYYTFEVSAHWQRGSSLLIGARIKVILLRDRFDHCSHTSDEVVQITAWLRVCYILLSSVAKVTPLHGLSCEPLLLPPREFLLMIP